MNIHHYNWTQVSEEKFLKNDLPREAERQKLNLGDCYRGYIKSLESRVEWDLIKKTHCMKLAKKLLRDAPKGFVKW